MGTCDATMGPCDATMGPCDAAEVCELVDLYVLDMLSKKYEKSPIAVYRDDGLAAFRSYSQL